MSAANTQVVYTGTADVRIVAPGDFEGDVIKEEIHFRPGVPETLTKKAWKAIQENASLAPVFSTVEEAEAEEDDEQETQEPDGLPQLPLPS